MALMCQVKRNLWIHVMRTTFLAYRESFNLASSLSSSAALCQYTMMDITRLRKLWHDDTLKQDGEHG